MKYISIKRTHFSIILNYIGRSTETVHYKQGEFFLKCYKYIRTIFNVVTLLEMITNFYQTQSSLRYLSFYGTWFCTIIHWITCEYIFWKWSSDIVLLSLVFKLIPSILTSSIQVIADYVYVVSFRKTIKWKSKYI